MPILTGVSIKFHTHNQGKDFDTVVHVFVKISGIPCHQRFQQHR
jgi:hypothetical protein